MHSVEDICKSINLEPRTVVEVGAAHPSNQRLGSFINQGKKVIFVEANPRLFYCLVNGYDEGDFKGIWPNISVAPHQFEGYIKNPNVTVYNAAIAEKQGKTMVFERNASSFVGGIESPAKVNDGYIENLDDSYEVNAITIDQIDDGEIDVLLADVEGSEWFCIRGLISRPKIIILELYGWKYINPYINEILHWMEENNYILKESDISDALFIHTNYA